MDKARFLAVALVSAFVITGCAARGVRIAELKDQPDRYDDKTVSVTGVVTNSWGIPLLPFVVFTGSVVVFSFYSSVFHHIEESRRAESARI